MNKSAENDQSIHAVNYSIMHTVSCNLQR